ncbi:unnamed protein product [Mytilus coruscus]|uniref:Uncharacterized protein n=1 Tax=Mytilus coruscus TaxID=42192 RepID=A0A6J8DKW6_MYTCO|nr:unnamed protein product [Mytilus coruscus]
MATYKRTISDEESSFNSGIEMFSNYTRLQTKRPKLTEGKLNDVGVFFSEKPISMDNLIKNLKILQKGSKGSGNFPTTIDSLKNFTGDLLSFSLPCVNWSKKSTLPLALMLQEEEVEQESLMIICAINKTLSDFYEKTRCRENDNHLTLILTDRLSNRLFEHWYHRIFLFVSGMKEILEKLINPCPVPPGKYSDQEILQESVFTQIFLKFAQICFLNPEVGEASKKCLKIRNKTVGYVSDVRFYQHETKAGSPHLLMLLVEVKNNGLSQTDGDKDSATPWIEGYLDKCILEQIGLQLMSDIWNSTFAPSTLAVVCMRTEVIFMLLEADLEHYEAWLINKNTDNFKSFIQYTRSYNIMVADDRSQLLDLLFWLGCSQKGDFEHYFFF